MDMGLKGKSVLITGASQGIGRAAAIAFAREGCSLHLTARSSEKLQSLAAELKRDHGVLAHCHPFDMSERETVGALAEQCKGIDILINNAGEIPSGPLESLDEQKLRTGYEVKLFGYMLLCKAFYPTMKKRGSGVIINDIGNSGENWDANYIAGSTANAALMAFTKALGGVSLDYGVRVVGINPGPVETERMIKINKRRALDLYQDESRWESLREMYPAGRPALPEEVADLMVFLSSARAAYISGTIVTIDGGIAARGSIIKSRTI